MLLVLGALVVSYAQSLRVWFDQHQQISGLQKEIRDSEQRVGELEGEIARWDDDAYVRAQARQRFGWVLPGEVGYRVVGDDGRPVGTPAAAPKGSAETGQETNQTNPTNPTNPTNWYAKLWGSVEVAGTAEQRQDPAPPKAKPTPKRLLTPPSQTPR